MNSKYMIRGCRGQQSAKAFSGVSREGGVTFLSGEGPEQYQLVSGILGPAFSRIWDELANQPY